MNTMEDYQRTKDEILMQKQIDRSLNNCVLSLNNHSVWKKTDYKL